MSSILKALKKLESEKSQRDELSTAVASDILRSSRKKRFRSASFVAGGLIVVAILFGLGGYFIASSTDKEGEVVAPVNHEQTVPVVVSRQMQPPTVDRQMPDTNSSDPSPILPVLSGIVYQENSEDRMAIVNDLPAMEGTLVEGYMIKTILPDKVVVVRDGVHYSLVIQK